MANTLIETRISNLIENQFPAVFREDGELFVQFVKKYYEWMEENGGVIYHARRLKDYRDIDRTTDEFLVHFKKQYLDNVAFDNEDNLRMLLKHSQDLYRAKGTERGVKLLFQIAFGVLPKVFYPRDYLFKSSDGHWKTPKYLELIQDDNNAFFYNKQIVGETSGATAYVESVVRKRVGSIFVDLLYITSLVGEFEQHEQITTFASSNDINFRPHIMGSVVSVNVPSEGEGDGYAVGDVVNITAEDFAAKGIISDITSQSGLINFELIDGGYGFTEDSTVYISELTLNTTTPSSSNNFWFDEIASQKLGQILYVNANGNFNAGDSIFSYYANGTVKGQATVISTDIFSNVAGSLFVYVASGNIQANAIYSVSNTVGANLNVLGGYTDVSASGLVIGQNVVASVNKVYMVNTANQFIPGYPVKGANSSANAIVTRVFSGEGASFKVSNNLNFPETVVMNTDYLRDKANVALSANAYGFTANVVANSTNNTIFNCLTYESMTYGQISSFTNVISSKNYQEPPYVTIIDRPARGFDLKGYVKVGISNNNIQFVNGDIITQATTNFRGLVENANSTEVTIRVLRILANNQIEVGNVTSNNTKTAVVTSINYYNPDDVLGFNANVAVSLKSSNSAVAKIILTDSGVGFSTKEELHGMFMAEDKTEGHLTFNYSGVGTGTGYYTNKGSQLSGYNKIYDGYYWQDYSYDVVSGIKLSKYQKLLKDVIHTAGWVFFASFDHETTPVNLLSKTNEIKSYVQSS